MSLPPSTNKAPNVFLDIQDNTGAPTVKSSSAESDVTIVDVQPSPPGAPPVSNFTATPVTGDTPLNVTFTDSSTGSPTSWLWDFGDGNTSTDQNPVHIYTSDGTFTVSLTVSNDNGTDTHEIVDYITSTVPASEYWSSFNYFPNSQQQNGGFFAGCSHDSTGALIAVGGQDYNENYVNVYKWNSTGALLWNTQIGNLNSYNDIYGEFPLIDSSDNIYVVSTDYSVWPSRILVSKLDPAGAVVWQNTYQCNSSRSDVFDGAVLADGIILSSWQSWLLKIDFDGNLAWTKSFTAISTRPTTLAVTPTGIYSSSEYGGITRFDLDGNVVWSKMISGPSTYRAVIASYGEELFYATYTYIVRLDATGNIIKTTSITPLDYAIASLKVKNNKLYFATGNGSVGSYDIPTDTVDYFYQTYMPDYNWPYAYYYNSFTYCMSVSPAEDEFVFVGFWNTGQSVVFNLPTDLGAYSGLETIENECTVGPLSYVVEDVTGSFSTNIDSPVTASQTITIEASTYPVEKVTYEEIAGPLVPYVSPIPPMANFSADVTSGYAPLTVNFTDLSLNDPTYRSWSFGDNNYSTDINPTHIYTTPGSYAVNLFVSNPVGSSSKDAQNYITVNSAYQATWDASTNTPSLSNGVGTTGHIYIVNVPGTIDIGAGPVTYAIGDLLIYDGSVWNKSPAGTANSNITYIRPFGTTTYPLDNDTNFPGAYYIAANSGTIYTGPSGITFDIGDYIFKSAAGVWQKVPAYSAGFGQPITVTTNALSYISFPLYGLVNGALCWGDNTFNLFNYMYGAPSTYLGEASKSYSTVAVRTIKLVGEWSTLFPPSDKLTAVNSFGNTRLRSLRFNNNSTLTSVPSSIPNTVNTLHRVFYNSSAAANLTMIQSWDTSNVTSLYEAFAYATSFNVDISGWNTSNVTNMAGTFDTCAAFNRNISSWDTSKVTNMYRTFAMATSFNQPLDTWNTSNVTNMSYMFNNAYAFNQPINSWDVSKVTDMSGMFYSAIAFNQPLDLWNTSSLTLLWRTFYTSSFNQSINSWNVSNVVTTSGMFEGNTVFNQPLNSWNTSSLTDISSMFSGATAFNQPLSNWDVSNVIQMASTFYGATSFNQPLNSWNTISVVNMSGIFGQASAFNQPLDLWNTSSVTNMSYMFSYATSFNQPLSTWDTSHVTNMSIMFKFATSFNRDISNWVVTLIPIKPSDFSLNCPIDGTVYEPIWGA